MIKNISLILVVVIYLVLVFTATVTTYATGENLSSDLNSQTSSNDVSSTSSETNSESSSSVNSSEDSDVSSTTSSDVSSNDSSDTGSTTSSDVSSTTSSESNESGSDEGNSSSETTSETTSSSEGGITSAGAGGGSTFIDETGSGGNVGIGNTSGTDTLEQPIDENEDLDHYVGNASTFGSKIYKVIWIPIVVALMCIGGLVYINLVYKKRFVQAGSTGKNSSGTKNARSSSKVPVARRRK